MRTTRQLSATVANSLVAVVKSRVTAGDSASASEVTRDGWPMPLVHDQTIENWLQNVVCPACDALQTAPDNIRTTAQVRARIDARHAQSR